eukprot:TRINITY_DN32102_c0_g1_i1.p1 TRINITY_DN32102_c0_g1~~TRINITY_DN32102_c0_g1_i1.p1  ORF type:complete len:342 (+),score=75.66 TRINITY_DN32102_c0_g1_i1:97-1122(+)
MTAPPGHTAPTGEAGEGCKPSSPLSASSPVERAPEDESDWEEPPPMTARSNAADDPEEYRADPGLRRALEELDAVTKRRPDLDAFCIDRFFGAPGPGGAQANAGGQRRERRSSSPRQQLLPRRDVPASLIDCPPAAAFAGAEPQPSPQAGGSLGSSALPAGGAATPLGSEAPEDLLARAGALQFSTDLLFAALRSPQAQAAAAGATAAAQQQQALAGGRQGRNANALAAEKDGSGHGYQGQYGARGPPLAPLLHAPTGTSTPRQPRPGRGEVTSLGLGGGVSGDVSTPRSAMRPRSVGRSGSIGPTPVAPAAPPPRSGRDSGSGRRRPSPFIGSHNTAAAF